MYPRPSSELICEDEEDKYLALSSLCSAAMILTWDQSPVFQEFWDSVAAGSGYSLCAAACNTDNLFDNRARAGALYYREVMVLASGAAAVLALLTLATLIKKNLDETRGGMPKTSDALFH